jgi:hypothetical protein
VVDARRRRIFVRLAGNRGSQRCRRGVEALGHTRRVPGGRACLRRVVLGRSDSPRRTLEVRHAPAQPGGDVGVQRRTRGLGSGRRRGGHGARFDRAVLVAGRRHRSAAQPASRCLERGARVGKLGLEHRCPALGTGLMDDVASLRRPLPCRLRSGPRRLRFGERVGQLTAQPRMRRSARRRFRARRSSGRTRDAQLDRQRRAGRALGAQLTLQVLQLTPQRVRARVDVGARLLEARLERGHARAVLARRGAGRLQVLLGAAARPAFTGQRGAQLVTRGTGGSRPGPLAFELDGEPLTARPLAGDPRAQGIDLDAKVVEPGPEAPSLVFEHREAHRVGRSRSHLDAHAQPQLRGVHAQPAERSECLIERLSLPVRALLGGACRFARRLELAGEFASRVGRLGRRRQQTDIGGRRRALRLDRVALGLGQRVALTGERLQPPLERAERGDRRFGGAGLCPLGALGASGAPLGQHRAVEDLRPALRRRSGRSAVAGGDVDVGQSHAGSVGPLEPLLDRSAEEGASDQVGGAPPARVRGVLVERRTPGQRAALVAQDEYRGHGIRVGGVGELPAQAQHPALGIRRDPLDQPQNGRGRSGRRRMRHFGH